MKSAMKYIVLLCLIPLSAVAQSGYMGKIYSVGYTINTRPQVYPAAISDIFTGDVSFTWEFRHEIELGMVIKPQVKLEAAFFFESVDYIPRGVSGVYDGQNVTNMAGIVTQRTLGGRGGAKFYISDLGALAPIGWYVGAGGGWGQYHVNLNDALYRVRNPDGSHKFIAPHLIDTDLYEITLDLNMGYSRVFFDRVLFDAGFMVRFPFLWATDQSVRDATVESAWLKSTRERIALLNAFHARTSISYLF